MTMYRADVFIDYRLNEVHEMNLGKEFNLTLQNTPKFSGVKNNHLFHIKVYKIFGKELPLLIHDIEFTGTITSINQCHDSLWTISGVVV